jgi:hypothetical protein
MAKEEVVIDYQYYEEKVAFSDLKEASEKLINSSGRQFEEIKKEKWYNRVFDMVTFSQKGKKRMAEQIGSIAQAQQILMEILFRLSDSNEEVAQLVTDCIDDIKKLQENDLYLLNRINELVNYYLLGIRKDTDIAELSDKDKAILSGCLYNLMDKYDSINGVSEGQQQYANAVLIYIEINKNRINDEKIFTAIDTLSLKSKSEILTCCMEYMFLNNNTMEIPNELKEFLEAFDIGNKTLKNIQKQIVETSKLRGNNGLIDKYMQKSFAYIDEEFYVDIDEDSLDVEEADEAGEEEMEMTDVYISNMLQVKTGEVKKFQYNNVHIGALINCEGDMEFENCVIYYNESDASDEITLSKNSSITFKNSVIICKDYDKSVFIKGEENNTYLFENCTFLDCSKFVKGDSVAKFIMQKCEVKNCYDGFVNITLNRYSDCDVSGCLITEDDIAQFNIEGSGKRSLLFGPSLYLFRLSGDKDSNFTIADNRVIENKHNEMIYFSARHARIRNCTFKKASGCFEGVRNLKDCRFEECEKVISTMSSNYDTKRPIVDNCSFEKCTGILSLDNNSTVSNCQFLNCYDYLISQRDDNGGIIIEFCEFINTIFNHKYNSNPLLPGVISESCITFKRGKGKETSFNAMRKCSFKSASLKGGFMISATGYEKPSGTVAYIEDCEFLNCSTKRPSGKIIKEYMQYDTTLKKNVDFKANEIKNCKGLDKIKNKIVMDHNVEVKTKNAEGKPIGSSVVSAELFAPLGLSGAAIGVTGIAAKILTQRKDETKLA